MNIVVVVFISIRLSKVCKFLNIIIIFHIFDFFKNIYSGNVFILNILEESTLLSYCTTAIQNTTGVSLAANYPTIVSVLDSLINSLKNLVIAVERKVTLCSVFY